MAEEETQQPEQIIPPNEEGISEEPAKPLEYRNLRSGPDIVTSVPTAKSFEGNMLLYKDTGSGIYRLYGKVNQDWRLLGSSQFITQLDIGSLTDVDITSVGDNEVLAYDSSSGKWINQTAAEAGLATSGHTHAVDDLSDANITSVTDNEVLAYDTSTGNWINQTAAEAGISADIVILRQDWDFVALDPSESETTLKTYTLPGGTLGANDGLRITIFHSLNNSGTATFKLKVDGDIVITHSEQSPQSYHTTFHLFNKDSTTANFYFVNIIGLTASQGGAVFEEGNFHSDPGWNTTGNIDIIITGATDSNGSMQVFGWVIEHLKA